MQMNEALGGLNPGLLQEGTGGLEEPIHALTARGGLATEILRSPWTRSCRGSPWPGSSRPPASRPDRTRGGDEIDGQPLSEASIPIA